MRTLLPLTLLLTILLAASACDDGGDDNNTTNNVNTCGNGLAEDAESCDGADLRGSTCASINLGFSGGTLACAPTCQWDTSDCLAACEDACEDGEQECNIGHTARRVCAVQANGCTGWTETACPVDFPDCELEGGTARCVEDACVNACSAGSRRCSSNELAIETCVTGPRGCTIWESEPCDYYTSCVTGPEGPVCEAECYMECYEPGTSCEGTRVLECKFTSSECSHLVELENCDDNAQVCRMDTATSQAVCATPGPGDTCATAIEPTLPHTVDATGFRGEFSDSLTFWSCGWTSGPEIVFTLDMTAGQRVALVSDSMGDAALYVFEICEMDVASCLSSINTSYSGIELLAFDAPADGTYFFAVEVDQYSVDASPYTIHLYTLDDTETDCADGRDNDLNRLTDCADVACYGQGTCPVLIWSEDFNTWPPPQWTITNGGDPAYTWFSSADDLMAREFYPASGLFAMVDPDASASGVPFNEALTTPAIDCSATTVVELEFAHFYIDNSLEDMATVEVSADGGASWSPVRIYSTDYDSSPWGGELQRFDISSPAAGQAEVRLRFTYVTNTYDYYWLIDSVRVFAR